MQFHWADYLLFVASLLVGLVLGVVSIFKQKREQKGEGATTKGYMLGGGNMNFIVVGASMLLSVLNSVFLLGGSSEVYYRGAIYGLYAVAPQSIFTIFLFIPTWRKELCISAYEVLEKRFNSLALRQFGAFLCCLRLLLFLSVVLYTPALALNQVTGLSMHIAIIACGGVCTIYTALGGLKAVIWTDSLQACIMLVGLTVVCIMGTIQVGGVLEVYTMANKLGRLNFNNLNIHPHERHSIWSIIFGLNTTWSLGTLSDQLFVQRYMALPSCRKAQIAYAISKVMFVATISLVCALGTVMSVFYMDCDPLAAGEINQGDQLLPYFFINILGPYPGLSGLFIAAIFAAALSTISSFVNVLSLLTLQDFIKPLKAKYGKPLETKYEVKLAVILSFVYGIISIGLAYLAPLLGPAVIQIPPTVTGAVGPALFSIFVQAFYVPFANKWGCWAGAVTGLAVNLWVSIGGIMYGKSPLEDNLPVGLQCSAANETTTWDYTTGADMYTTTEATIVDDNPLKPLYDMSYCWIAVFGVIVSLSVGLTVSGIAHCLGAERKTNATTFDDYAPEEKAKEDKFETSFTMTNGMSNGGYITSKDDNKI